MYNLSIYLFENLEKCAIKNNDFTNCAKMGARWIFGWSVEAGLKMLSGPRFRNQNGVAPSPGATSPLKSSLRRQGPC